MPVERYNCEQCGDEFPDTFMIEIEVLGQVQLLCLDCAEGEELEDEPE